MSGIDLTTYYLGLKLRSPLVVSACQPLSDSIASIRKMEDNHAGAVVLYSLFEEQLTQDTHDLHRHLTEHTDSFAEASSFFPEPDEFTLGPDEYLKFISKAKEAVQIPIIASLNGTTAGGWTKFAKQMEQAGADAIELNIYRVNSDMDQDAFSVENECLEILHGVKSAVKIPVAVKLSPFYTSIANVAKKLDLAGVNGLVLFNRFYQPDIDLEELRVRPDIILSSPLSLRLPLRWIAILYGKISADLAATSGIHRSEDVLKLLMAGASVTMLCSALLRYGIDYMSVIHKKLLEWMEEHSYASLDMMRGSMSQMHCEHPPVFERAQYLKAIHSFRPRNPI